MALWPFITIMLILVRARPFAGGAEGRGLRARGREGRLRMSMVDSGGTETTAVGKRKKAFPVAWITKGFVFKQKQNKQECL